MVATLSKLVCDSQIYIGLYGRSLFSCVVDRRDEEKGLCRFMNYKDEEVR